MACKCALLCLLVLLPQCLAITTPYLVFSSWFTVSRMTLDGSGYEELVEYGGSVGKQAVDYHWRLNLLFWTHFVDDTVNQASLDGSDATVIASGVDTPDSLAVDWINDNLYFSYADSTNYYIAVYNITRGGNWEVMLTSSSRFYEIAVDPVDQWLYWTTGHAIVRSTLSGSNPETIFPTTTLDCVFSLALNTQLYWSERCFNFTTRSVRSLNLTTLSESVIIEDTSIDPFYGVAAFEDSVFWTENAAVYTMLAGGGGTANQVYQNSSYGGTQFRGIVVVDPALQPDPRSSRSPPSPSSSSSTIAIATALPLALALVSLVFIGLGTVVVVWRRKRQVGGNRGGTVQEAENKEDWGNTPDDDEPVGEDMNKPSIPSGPGSPVTLAMCSSEQKNAPREVEERYVIIKSPSPDPNFHELDDEKSPLKVSGAAASSQPQPGVERSLTLTMNTVKQPKRL